MSVTRLLHRTTFCWQSPMENKEGVYSQPELRIVIEKWLQYTVLTPVVCMVLGSDQQQTEHSHCEVKRYRNQTTEYNQYMDINKYFSSMY